MAKKNNNVKEELKLKNPNTVNENALAWSLAVFTFLLYAQTVNYDFALDDIAVVKGNKFVHLGFAGFPDILKTFYWAGFWQTNAGLFRPASLILFAIEWAFAPDSPHAFHMVNVLLYAVSAFLLFRMLRELIRDISPVFAFATTLLWVVLPAHTEVVANVKSADELLSVIFFLMMMRRLIKWHEDKKISSLLISGIWFFIALLSKEGAALFLPMAFLALWMFRGEKNWKNYLEPAAMFGSVGMIWFIWHWWVIKSAPDDMITYNRGDNILTVAPDIVSRVATAMNMQAKYFQKLFLGYPLSYDYSWNQNPIVGLGDPLALFAIASFLALFYAAYRCFKKYPVISFGIIFYFVTFALTSNIFFLIGATMADRFLFAPSIGACMVIVYFVMSRFKELQAKKFMSKSLVLLAFLSFIYSVRTFIRSQDWANEDTLFAADINNAPGSGRVLQNYAISQMNAAFRIKDDTPQRRQLLDDSYNYFIKAAAIDTSDFRSLLCLGQVEYNRARYMQSAAWTKKYIDYFHARGYPPGDRSCYSNIGDAFMKYNRYDSAAMYFLDGMKADSNNDYVSMKAAECYMLSHDTTKAIELFDHTVKVNPKNIAAWKNLANLTGASGQHDRSTEAFEELLKLDPADPSPYRMIMTNYLLKHTKEDSAMAQQYFDAYRNHGGK